jgi:hypothetical protein
MSNVCSLFNAPSPSNTVTTFYIKDGKFCVATSENQGINERMISCMRCVPLCTVKGEWKYKTAREYIDERRANRNSIPREIIDAAAEGNDPGAPIGYVNFIEDDPVDAAHPWYTSVLDSGNGVFNIVSHAAPACNLRAIGSAIFTMRGKLQTIGQVVRVLRMRGEEVPARFSGVSTEKAPYYDFKKFKPLDLQWIYGNTLGGASSASAASSAEQGSGSASTSTKFPAELRAEIREFMKKVIKLSELSPDQNEEGQKYLAQLNGFIKDPMATLLKGQLTAAIKKK